MSFTQSSLTVKDAHLATYRWLPTEESQVVILILHGMGEHAKRYDHFAQFLTQHGFAVSSQDHRGHGQSAQTEEQIGHFSDREGWELVVQDAHLHIQQLKKEFPEKKIIILGHSMGSFITQEFLIRYGDLLDGAILSGSNGKPNFLATIGRWIAKFEKLRLGKTGRSKLLNKLSFDEFNKAFKPTRTSFDWLSRNEENVDRYIADPLCGFICTTQLWVDLLDGIVAFSKPHRQKQIPKELPIYIFSGARDPVGLEGKGVRQLIDAYATAGLNNVTYKLYHEGRHEMLNESNKEEVYADVLQWLKENIC